MLVISSAHYFHDLVLETRWILVCFTTWPLPPPQACCTFVRFIEFCVVTYYMSRLMPFFRLTLGIRGTPSFDPVCCHAKRTTSATRRICNIRSSNMVYRRIWIAIKLQWIESECTLHTQKRHWRQSQPHVLSRCSRPNNTRVAGKIR